MAQIEQFHNSQRNEELNQHKKYAEAANSILHPAQRRRCAVLIHTKVENQAHLNNLVKTEKKKKLFSHLPQTSWDEKAPANKSRPTLVAECDSLSHAGAIPSGMA
jgi:hypothetical protein